MDMVVGNIYTRLGIDSGPLAQGVAKSIGHLQSYTDKLNRVSNSLTSLGLKAKFTFSLPMAFAVRKAITEFANFDEAMRNVNTIARDTEVQLAKTAQAVTDLARDVGRNPTELAKGLYFINSSGFKAAEAMDVLKASALAARAGLAHTEETAKALVGVLNAYSLPASNVTHVSDILFKTVEHGITTISELTNHMGTAVATAAAAQIPFEDLAAAIVTMTRAGVETPESFTAINRMILRITKGNEELNKLFAMTKEGSGSAMLAVRGLAGTMQFLIRHTGGSVDEFQRLGFYVRDLRAALSLARNGGLEFAKAVQWLGNKTSVVGSTMRAFQEQTKAMRVQWDQMKATFSQTGIQLVTILAPGINKLIGAISRAAEWFSKLNASTQRWVAYSAIAVAAFSTITLTLAALSSVLSIGITGLVGFATWLGLVAVAADKTAISVAKVGAATVASNAAMAGSTAVGAGGAAASRAGGLGKAGVVGLSLLAAYGLYRHFSNQVDTNGAQQRQEALMKSVPSPISSGEDNQAIIQKLRGMSEGTDAGVDLSGLQSSIGQAVSNAEARVVETRQVLRTIERETVTPTQSDVYVDNSPFGDGLDRQNRVLASHLGRFDEVQGELVSTVNDAVVSELRQTRVALSGVSATLQIANVGNQAVKRAVADGVSVDVGVDTQVHTDGMLAAGGNESINPVVTANRADTGDREELSNLTRVQEAISRNIGKVSAGFTAAGGSFLLATVTLDKTSRAVRQGAGASGSLFSPARMFRGLFNTRNNAPSVLRVETQAAADRMGMVARRLGSGMEPLPDYRTVLPTVQRAAKMGATTPSSMAAMNVGVEVYQERALQGAGANRVAEARLALAQMEERSQAVRNASKVQASIAQMQANIERTKQSIEQAKAFKNQSFFQRSGMGSPVGRLNAQLAGLREYQKTYTRNLVPLLAGQKTGLGRSLGAEGQFGLPRGFQITRPVTRQEFISVRGQGLAPNRLRSFTAPARLGMSAAEANAILSAAIPSTPRQIIPKFSPIPTRIQKAFPGVGSLWETNPALTRQGVASALPSRMNQAQRSIAEGRVRAASVRSVAGYGITRNAPMESMARSLEATTRTMQQTVETSTGRLFGGVRGATLLPTFGGNRGTLDSVSFSLGITRDAVAARTEMLGKMVAKRNVPVALDGLAKSTDRLLGRFDDLGVSTDFAARRAADLGKSQRVVTERLAAAAREQSMAANVKASEVRVALFLEESKLPQPFSVGVRGGVSARSMGRLATVPIGVQGRLGTALYETVAQMAQPITELQHVAQYKPGSRLFNELTAIRPPVNPKLVAAELSSALTRGGRIVPTPFVDQAVGRSGIVTQRGVAAAELAAGRGALETTNRLSRLGAAKVAGRLYSQPTFGQIMRMNVGAGLKAGWGQMRAKAGLSAAEKSAMSVAGRVAAESKFAAKTAVRPVTGLLRSAPVRFASNYVLTPDLLTTVGREMAPSFGNMFLPPHIDAQMSETRSLIGTALSSTWGMRKFITEGIPSGVSGFGTPWLEYGKQWGPGAVTFKEHDFFDPLRRTAMEADTQIRMAIPEYNAQAQKQLRAGREEGTKAYATQVAKQQAILDDPLSTEEDRMWANNQMRLLAASKKRDDALYGHALLIAERKRVLGEIAAAPGDRTRSFLGMETDFSGGGFEAFGVIPLPARDEQYTDEERRDIRVRQIEQSRYAQRLAAQAKGQKAIAEEAHIQAWLEEKASTIDYFRNVGKRVEERRKELRESAANVLKAMDAPTLQPLAELYEAQKAQLLQVQADSDTERRNVEAQLRNRELEIDSMVGTDKKPIPEERKEELRADWKAKSDEAKKAIDEGLEKTKRDLAAFHAAQTERTRSLIGLGVLDRLGFSTTAAVGQESIAFLDEQLTIKDIFKDRPKERDMLLRSSSKRHKARLDEITGNTPTPAYMRDAFVVGGTEHQQRLAQMDQQILRNAGVASGAVLPGSVDIQRMAEWQGLGQARGALATVNPAMLGTMDFSKLFAGARQAAIDAAPKKTADGLTLSDVEAEIKKLESTDYATRMQRLDNAYNDPIFGVSTSVSAEEREAKTKAYQNAVEVEKRDPDASERLARLRASRRDLSGAGAIEKNFSDALASIQQQSETLRMFGANPQRIQWNEENAVWAAFLNKEKAKAEKSHDWTQFSKAKQAEGIFLQERQRTKELSFLGLPGVLNDSQIQQLNLLQTFRDARGMFGGDPGAQAMVDEAYKRAQSGFGIAEAGQNLFAPAMEAGSLESIMMHQRWNTQLSAAGETGAKSQKEDKYQQEVLRIWKYIMDNGIKTQDINPDVVLGIG